MSEGVVDAKFQALLDDLALGHFDEGCMDFEFRGAFHSGFGGEVRHLLERLNIFRAAVGVAGVVDDGDADENILRSGDLRRCQAE